MRLAALFRTRSRFENRSISTIHFPASHPRWSFAKTDAQGRVTAVAEKRPISKQATVGLYYFRRAGDLFDAAERMIVKGLTTAGEFFVAPVYNELILDGKAVTAFHLPDGAMQSLGTPEDLAWFIDQRSRTPHESRAAL